MIATDPDQLKRVVRRVFLAFSSANGGVDWGNSGRCTLSAPRCSAWAPAWWPPSSPRLSRPRKRRYIINAMLAAETMTGADYRRAWALPHDQVKAILGKYNRLQRR